MLSNNFLEVNFDSQQKSWKSVNYPYKHLTNRSLGEAFLRSMRSLEPKQVLEYHYDEQKEKCVRDLYQESIMVAKNLQRLGMKKGDVILLFSGYSYMTSSLTFGTILAGGVVNFFEVKLENEDIDKMIEVIQPFMILYEDIFLAKIVISLKRRGPKSLKYIFGIDNTKTKTSKVQSELLTFCGTIDFDKFEPVRVDSPETEIAFLVLTSGSTGLPKVTQLTHCLLLNGVYVWWANPYNYEPLNSNSLLFSLSPLRWISQVGLLLQSAILGIKRICANKAGTGRYGLEILRTTKPTHMFSVPSFLYEILLELKEGDKQSLDSLKYIQLGGEPPSSVITNLSKQFAVNSKLFYSYGMSETACSITNDENVSGGKLQHGFEMQILDDNLEPLGHNQQGQLAVKTPYPFVGYKDKDKNQYFLQNGYFLNGDFGYFDEENTLHLLGRLTDFIKCRNIVLIPNLLEPLVLNLPEIIAVRLVGYRHSEDDANEVAALFVVLKEHTLHNDEFIPTKIRSALLGLLSEDKISLIRDIYMEEKFPLTTCGKIDRIALQNLAIKRAKQQ